MFFFPSSEVFRLNLEQGRFLNPLQTDSVYVVILSTFIQIFGLCFQLLFMFLYFCIVHQGEQCVRHQPCPLLVCHRNVWSKCPVCLRKCLTPKSAPCYLLQSVTRVNLFNATMNKWRSCAETSKWSLVFFSGRSKNSFIFLEFPLKRFAPYPFGHREGWNAGTLVTGTEWACWTVPWAACLREAST